MRMYVDDNRAYPLGAQMQSAAQGFPSWYDALAQYHRLSWTNRAFHCPTYKWVIRDGLSPLGSYSYNINGTSGNLQLGLGGLVSIPSVNNLLPTSDLQVKAPSDMFAIADAKIISVGTLVVNAGMISAATGGSPYMATWNWFAGDTGEPQPLRHGKGFNFLFCDGHVSLVKRNDFMNRTNSWRNWNRDQQPHMETWF